MHETVHVSVRVFWRRVMMKFDRGRNVRRQFPDVGENPPRIAMRETQHFLFYLTQRSLGISRQVKNHLKIFFKEKGIDENSYVVEQPGKVQLLDILNP